MNDRSGGHVLVTTSQAPQRSAVAYTSEKKASILVEGTICYLCGKDIDLSGDATVDHVPPKVLFPESLRRERNFSNFWTVPAHRSCNQQFSRDEQYFFYSLGLICNGSETGRYAAQKIIDSVQHRDDRLPLHVKIDREFYRDPLGQLRKTFDHDRIYRVAEKIVRGLWFIRAGQQQILPSDWRAVCALYDRNNPPPQVFQELMAENEQWGEYPNVFFFKAVTFTEGAAHAFLLVFWEWLLITVMLHEATCSCDECRSS